MKLSMKKQRHTENIDIAKEDNAKKRPDPVAALPIIHHFTLAAILTSVPTPT